MLVIAVLIQVTFPRNFLLETVAFASYAFGLRENSTLKGGFQRENYSFSL
jgi:hypothetical protein